jgi:hypothetical protein
LQFDGHTVQLLHHLLSLFQRFQEEVLVLNLGGYFIQVSRRVLFDELRKLVAELLLLLLGFA